MSEDTKLNVKLNGKDVTIDVIDIIENTEGNKQYIVYTVEGNPDDMYMSILEETEDSFILKEITDANEAQIVENYLEQLVGEVEKENGV